MQVRVTLSDLLQTQLKERADYFGLTMSEYIKYLIVSDLKNPLPSKKHTPPSIQKHLLKKNPWKGYDLMDG